MFNYYGSKSKIVEYYPKPKFKKIIEPFAGSARYSLKYWECDILLIDKYPIIVEIWNFLKKCTQSDILGLPKLKEGDILTNYNLTSVEISFLQYITQHGTVGGHKVSKWGARDYDRNIKNIAQNLYKIKHWNIVQDDFINIENQVATWFIDPPYQFGGHKYKFSNKLIDFNYLSKWCKSREGQVIVCENTKADWLPFKPVKSMQGIKFTTTEAMWSNQKTNYDNPQSVLFM
jgi:site-specific DNA-adenine methylase